jgi:uncharacterized protein
MKENTMEIPRYPEARELTLSDKPLLDQLFLALQPRISECTFANLFLFREVHQYRLTQVEGATVVLGRGYDGSSYFLPPLSGDLARALGVLWGEGLVLYGADDPFLERFVPASGYQVLEDRDNADYLHLREELATLPGSVYHKKKNRVNYFALRHHYSVELLEQRHLEQAQAVLNDWLKVRLAQGAGGVAGEVAGAGEALRLHRELGLSGVVVLVDGVVRGFSLGERLNANTSVCHFEKGDLYLDGLYQLLNREFCRLLFTDCAYVNREQDLGEPSLRQAKLSYHPLELVRKYRVRRG